MENCKTYSVGMISKLAGISNRTLQYYDNYGLLKCKRSENGRRVYYQSDIFRLQQILFLKSYGFSLKDIKEKLLNITSSEELSTLLTSQVKIISKDIENLEYIKNHLNTLIQEVQNCERLDINKFVKLLRISRIAKPYSYLMNKLSDEQSEKIMKESNEELYERQLENDRLLLDLYKSGADPLGEKGQKLAERYWLSLQKVSGGD
ncbi:MAG TPA: MerR family transcriptional regulator, partial [Ruminiclostridium sp.]|nr:MerR family transcriptional regulator [Ruminiclostridium sp.]